MKNELFSEKDLQRFFWGTCIITSMIGLFFINIFYLLLNVRINNIYIGFFTGLFITSYFRIMIEKHPQKEFKK